MQVLREKVRQRVGIKNYGNGAYLLKKGMTQHCGRAFYSSNLRLNVNTFCGLRCVAPVARDKIDGA
jgi:hypothetical protein